MVEARVQRRLAAILAADMVDYSRQMAADEAGTLARLKNMQAGLMIPAIVEHGGRIVKEMGDGMLVEFASVVEAVECATAVQHGLANLSADEPRDRRIEFRIGINLGDIISQSGDIYGDGVNVAARLEALADAGGICLTAKAYEEVKGKVDLRYDDLGERHVKNIDAPIHIYQVRLGSNDPSPIATPKGTDEPAAVAVLPFVNMPLST